MHIVVQEAGARPAQEQPLEIVERKGKGHPDTICDAVVERVAVALARAYMKKFGRVLHHNVDKALLVAGRVDCWLGGGRVLEPMRLVIGDRASIGLGKGTIPVPDLVVRTARDWFKRNLPHLDPEKHVEYQVELKPTSAELGALFGARRGRWRANDTSAAVGYAPLTPTERLVLDVEWFLNGPLFKREFPQTGEDVKVMARRIDDHLSVIVAMPILATGVRTEADYFRQRSRILSALKGYVARRPHGCKHVEVTLNALDRPGLGIDVRRELLGEPLFAAAR